MDFEFQKCPIFVSSLQNTVASDQKGFYTKITQNSNVYRAIGNYCDAGSTLFGAEISISHKFCFFKNFCLGYDLSDNMKYFFCVMNF